MNNTEHGLRERLLKALEGDATAYAQFLAELARHLRAYFRKRLSGLPDEVEDMVQETLIAVHNQRHTYDPAQPLTAWIFAIAHYKRVDMLRRNALRQAHHVPLDAFMIDEISSTHSAEDAGQAKRDLAQLLATLPQRMRLPIQCVKLDGMSIAEAAQQCSMSESAVKVGIHRGLKKLASLIREFP